MPASLPLVDVKHARLVGPAGADGLRRDRLVDVLLLEIQQRLQPLTLLGVFEKSGLLQPQPVDCLLQIRVLLPHMAQIDVVVPEPRNA